MARIPSADARRDLMIESALPKIEMAARDVKGKHLALSTEYFWYDIFSPLPRLLKKIDFTKWNHLTATEKRLVWSNNVN